MFNICCEWSLKILPPSINIYCFSGFPSPKRKCYFMLCPTFLEVCHSQRPGAYSARELLYVGPKEKEAGMEGDTAHCSHYFYRSTRGIVPVLIEFFYSAPKSFADHAVNTNSSNILHPFYHTAQTSLLVHCVALGI